MTSHKRRSLTRKEGHDNISMKCKEKSKSKSGDKSSQNLPLLNKHVYIDIKQGKQCELIEEQLKRLGAKVEKFLSCEVNYVISLNGPSKTHVKDDNPQSPSFGSMTSPFNCGPSPTGNNDAKRTVVSRGKALAQIACAKNQASSVVANAEKLGIKIISLDAANKWLDKELKKLDKELKNNLVKNEEKSSLVNPQSLENKKKKKLLKGSFIKFEAINKLFRPVKSEFPSWPKINLLAPPGICPFGEAKLKVQHQYKARKCVPATLIPTCSEVILGNDVEHADSKTNQIRKQINLKTSQISTVPELVGVPIVTAGEVKGNIAIHLKKSTQINKQQGYCDCCEIKFKDLDQHLTSYEHRAFTRDKSNYESLDSLINNVPSTVKFLQSVLLKHCVQKQDVSGSSENSTGGFLSVITPISPLTTEKIASIETAPTSLINTLETKDESLISKNKQRVDDMESLTVEKNTSDDPQLEKNLSAVVIRRPTPSGIFTSPRRRQPTPSKKPWVQERSMIFRDSPMASLQPSINSSPNLKFSETICLGNTRCFSAPTLNKKLETKKSVSRSLIRVIDFTQKANSEINDCAIKIEPPGSHIQSVSTIDVKKKLLGHNPFVLVNRIQVDNQNVTSVTDSKAVNKPVMGKVTSHDPFVLVNRVHVDKQNVVTSVTDSETSKCVEGKDICHEPSVLVNRVQVDNQCDIVTSVTIAKANNSVMGQEINHEIMIKDFHSLNLSADEPVVQEQASFACHDEIKCISSIALSCSDTKVQVNVRPDQIMQDNLDSSVISKTPIIEEIKNSHSGEVSGNNIALLSTENVDKHTTVKNGGEWPFLTDSQLFIMNTECLVNEIKPNTDIGQNNDELFSISNQTTQLESEIQKQESIVVNYIPESKKDKIDENILCNSSFLVENYCNDKCYVSDISQTESYVNVLATNINMQLEKGCLSEPSVFKENQDHILELSLEKHNDDINDYRCSTAVEHNVGENLLFSVPNIADRVKTRQRVSYVNSADGNEDIAYKSEHRRKKFKKANRQKQINSRKETKEIFIENSSCNDSCQNLENFSYEMHHQNELVLPAIPNIAERVKNRRSCTMFNHEGQYADSDNSIILSPGQLQLHREYIQKHKINTYSEESNTKRELSFSSDKDADSQKGSPAVVIRRRNPSKYRLHTNKDWSKNELDKPLDFQSSDLSKPEAMSEWDCVQKALLEPMSRDSYVNHKNSFLDLYNRQDDKKHRNKFPDQYNSPGDKKHRDKFPEQYNSPGDKIHRNKLPDQYNSPGDKKHRNKFPEQYNSPCDKKHRNKLPDQYNSPGDKKHRNKFPEQYNSPGDKKHRNKFPEQYNSPGDKKHRNKFPEQYNSPCEKKIFQPILTDSLKSDAVRVTHSPRLLLKIKRESENIFSSTLEEVDYSTSLHTQFTSAGYSGNKASQTPLPLNRINSDSVDILLSSTEPKAKMESFRSEKCRKRRKLDFEEFDKVFEEGKQTCNRLSRSPSFSSPNVKRIVLEDNCKKSPIRVDSPIFHKKPLVKHALHDIKGYSDLQAVIQHTSYNCTLVAGDENSEYSSDATYIYDSEVYLVNHNRISDTNTHGEKSDTLSQNLGDRVAKEYENFSKYAPHFPSPENAELSSWNNICDSYIHSSFVKKDTRVNARIIPDSNVFSPLKLKSDYSSSSSYVYPESITRKTVKQFKKRKRSQIDIDMVGNSSCTKKLKLDNF